MELGKLCGLAAVAGSAAITIVNTQHGGEPLPIVAILAVIGLLEYAFLK